MCKAVPRPRNISKQWHKTILMSFSLKVTIFFLNGSLKVTVEKNEMDSVVKRKKPRYLIRKTGFPIPGNYNLVSPVQNGE